MTDAYRQWNRILADYCLLSKGKGERACLSISPNILAAAWNEHNEEQCSIEDVEEAFAATVSEFFRKEVIPYGLSVFEETDGSGHLMSIGFLSASVLAAYQMEANNYYGRLEELLQEDFVKHFEEEALRGLWRSLRTWLHKVHDIDMIVNDNGSGPFCIVHCPLSQVPLRKVDLYKLPAFFAANRYTPESEISLSRLGRELDRKRTTLGFTDSGLKALSDERRELVIQQIAQELQAWKGLLENSEGGKFATFEIQLIREQRTWKLYFLPRRPKGFPTEFAWNDRLFESFDEGWYLPAEININDGHLLRDGFCWSKTSNWQTYALRYGGSAVLAFAPAAYQQGMVSRQNLLLNVECAVLCRADRIDQVREYLEEITGKRLDAVQGQGLPNGWGLFPHVIPVRQAESLPELFEPIDVETDRFILPVGGLHIRHNKWIVGGEPSIVISGDRSSRILPTINGNPVEMDEQGNVITAGKMANPGTYVISAGRGCTLRIEIIAPNHFAFESEPTGAIAQNQTSSEFVLPPGDWTVIGSRGWEIADIRSDPFCGSIHKVPFIAYWAINQSPLGQVPLICLQNPALPKPVYPFSGVSGRRLIARWSLSILKIGRSVSKIGLINSDSGVSIRKIWNQYVDTAQRLSASQLTQARRDNEWRCVSLLALIS